MGYFMQTKVNISAHQAENYYCFLFFFSSCTMHSILRAVASAFDLYP